MRKHPDSRPISEPLTPSSKPWYLRTVSHATPAAWSRIAMFSGHMTTEQIMSYLLFEKNIR